MDATRRVELRLNALEEVMNTYSEIPLQYVFNCLYITRTNNELFQYGCHFLNDDLFNKCLRRQNKLKWWSYKPNMSMFLFVFLSYEKEALDERWNFSTQAPLRYLDVATGNCSTGDHFDSCVTHTTWLLITHPGIKFYLNLSMIESIKLLKARFIR